ncbi:MAG: hypothetical protein Q8L05_04195, partial [Actinomycetota bacterium]|nr:hypothetical protein [Actinomycetota bacterium]
MLVSNHARRGTAVVAVGASATMMFAVMANSAFAAPTPTPTKAVSNASCPATPGVTPTTINLGWIGPKTGAAAANYIGSSEAAQLRIDQENAKGG